MSSQLLASLPSLTLEVAFVNAPLDASPTWVDVTAYLMVEDGFAFGRGRSSRLDGPQASTFTFTLRNEDRRFDPYYSAGAYYPNVTLRKRVRLSAVWSSATYRLWDGYVDEWAQESRGPNLAVCRVTATDAFKFLNLNRVDSLWVSTAKSLTPKAWYRLSEPDLSAGVVAADQMGAYDGEYASLSGYVTGFVSIEGLIAGDANTAAAGPGTTTYGVMRVPWAVAPSGDFTWCMWARHNDPTYAALIELLRSTSPTVAFDIGIDFDGTAYVHTTGLADNAILTSATAIANDGRPHFVVGARGGGLAALYVDGALDSFETVTSPSYAGVGIHFFVAVLGADEIDEVLFFDSVLSAGDIASLYDAGTGWVGDYTGDRIGRVLDLVGWPAARRALDTGISTMQAANASSAFGMIDQADVTEHGYTFVSGAGDITMFDRHYRIRTTANAFTFSDASATYPYSNIGYSPSEAELRNDAAYSAPGLTPQTAEDATSIAAYGRSRYDRTVYAQTTNELKGGAEWVVALYKDPQQRISSLEVLPQSATATLWPAVLSIDIGTRLRVTRTPQKVGSAITQDVFVEGLKHSFQSGKWTTHYDLSPVDPTGFWVWATTKWDDADMRWAF